RQSFTEWSKMLEADLGIENSIQKEEASNLLEADTFAAIDKKIILDLKNHILKETLPNNFIQEWIIKRRTKFFFSEFSFIYDALSNAASLLDEIRKSNLNISNPAEGFNKYSKSLYLIDRLYRKYIYSSEQAEHQNILKDLTNRIEKAYENSFLLKLNDNWQALVDNMQIWKIEKVIDQTQFHQRWVQPFFKKDTRVFVIISDGLRYESATELREKILQQDYYTADLTPVLSSLPSYTQIGMAAMLPHKQISFNNKNDIVFVDGVSSQGTLNRSKILQSFDQRSIAISAEDFLKMKANPDGREFIKPYNAIYIYNNSIDKTGDEKATESKVFEATETEFDYLIKIIKQVSNMNGNNMIITADHGYLYQHNRLDESDFTNFTTSGETYKISRRFIIGQNLSTNASVKKWKGSQVGFSDETEILIPKSINRLRIQGAGSRYVHGGSSLQEIVLPVLEINKARIRDIAVVEIDISAPSYNITSNSFGVSFYQKQPVGEKMMPRDLRVGFYTSGGQLISDITNLKFDSRDNDAAAREQRKTFLFTSDASKLNGQDVFLILEENVEDTTHFKTYKTITFRMLIAFSSEFDNF
ncbi:MAG: BREX-1 system phosphatase PglZ type A, partial [Mariniphaga sp.]